MARFGLLDGNELHVIFWIISRIFIVVDEESSFGVGAVHVGVTWHALQNVCVINGINESQRQRGLEDVIEGVGITEREMDIVVKNPFRTQPIAVIRSQRVEQVDSFGACPYIEGRGRRRRR